MVPGLYQMMMQPQQQDPRAQQRANPFEQAWLNMMQPRRPPPSTDPNAPQQPQQPQQPPPDNPYSALLNMVTNYEDRLKGQQQSPPQQGQPQPTGPYAYRSPNNALQMGMLGLNMMQPRPYGR